MTGSPLRHVFISYSTTDRGYVELLAFHLEGKGVRVWYDDTLGVGDHIGPSIQQAIDECFALLVVITPEAAASLWVNRELNYSIQQSKHIYPLMLRRADLPIEIAGTKYEDVTNDRLPSERLVAELQRIALANLTGEALVGGAIASRTGSTMVLRRREFWRSRQVLTTGVTVLGGAVGLLSGYANFTGVLLGWPALVTFAGLSAGLAGLSFIGLSVRDRPPAGVAGSGAPRPETLPTLRAADATPRSPDPQSQFAGRTAELSMWYEIHTNARLDRSSAGAYALGPVVLAIHGAPGVGKSAFALALARQLADQYPDGFFVASFGFGRTARAPADILRELLGQLGWSKDDMPDDTEDRVATLRSLTRGKKMLFLFDAARDHDQVRQVIPAEPDCAVIISSRRAITTSLGLAPRPALGLMSVTDSLDMLAAVSGTDWITAPETAVEIVELCGRLPLAIGSAAAQVRDGDDLRHVVENLRPPTTRLDALDYAGLSVQDRIRSEYQRLLPEQRVALVLLAQLTADTFVPWVLRPLMALEHGESSGIASSLASAKLIEWAGEDGTGRQRYRINPLVRLFAAGQVTGEGLAPAEIEAARDRLDAAYLDLADDVLHEVADGYTRVRTGPAAWRTSASVIARSISSSLDQIVRREFANVVRLILRAPMPTHHELIWRCALLLDVGVAPYLDRRTIIDAFDRALTAAQRSDHSLHTVDVLLAQAQFHAGIEENAEAFDVLERALGQLRSATDKPGQPLSPVVARRLRIARIRAGAYLQIGSYEAAGQTLGAADEELTRVDTAAIDPATRMDLRLLQIHNQAARRPANNGSFWSAVRDLSSRPDGAVTNDYVRFRTAVAQAEQLRRQHHWLDAGSHLRLAMADRDGDGRGLASAHYRLARLAIQEAHEVYATDAGQAAHRTALGREAVEQAALCVRTFRSIGDDVGVIRARCMLVRALVVAGQLMAATRLCYEIEGTLRGERWAEPDGLPLWARFARARGELQLAGRAYRSAWRSLTSAANLFATLHDWSGYTEVWRLLDRVHLEHPGALEDILHDPDDGPRTTLPV